MTFCCDFEMENSSHMFLDRVGNSFFLFNKNGTTYTIGPHWVGVLATFVVILGGTYVNIEVIDSKPFSPFLSILSYSFVAILFCATVYFFLSTALCDPGGILFAD